MYQRMILPRTGRTALLVSSVVACLTAGCTETALDGARERPSRLGMAAAVTSGVVASNRTEHFAESALRIRRHPALGPHTPEEIKRRAAVLIEPPRLATPPASVLASAGVNPPPTHQVASLGALPPLSSAPPATADVTRVRAGAESVDLERRPSGGRNVVIPMVVTSNDRGTWRAEDGSGGTGARNGHCRDEALAQLKQHSASGYRIYERLTDKKMFTTWILCDDRQRGLTTAVHEAVHMLTEQLDAYPLIDGGQIARIPALEKFARPGKIAGQFKRSDDFVKTYLRPGGASSADDFTYLLDEFNAYVHDLNTAIQTQSIAPRDVRLGHRDGMSAMMSFLMAYVAMVEQEEPRTWAGLYRPDVKHLVTTLWSEAERTIEKSCAIPRYSVDDAPFLTHICTPANGRALGQLLGRAPRCPRACLGTASG
jgi:hypothetical protein